VSLLEIPFGLFACLVRQIWLVDIQQVNWLLMQVRKLYHCLSNTGLARCNFPVHALDGNVQYVVTGVRNMRQSWQTAQVLSCLSNINGCVDEINLVYSSTYWLLCSTY
jgi:hypothetical protein